MQVFKEFAIALARILLGMFLLMEGIIVLVFVHYLSSIGDIYSETSAVTYAESYEAGYAQTYNAGYETAYAEALDSGYDQGYAIGRETVSGTGVPRTSGLINPTYDEMREFLASDETDKKLFINNDYVCSDFSAEVNHRAEASGIRAAYVRIRGEKWGHAIVAFETVDRGLIFIEPQSDREVELVVGQPYPWYRVGAVTALTPHEPITEIQVIW